MLSLCCTGRCLGSCFPWLCCLLQIWTHNAKFERIQRWNPFCNYPFNVKKPILKVGCDYSCAIKQVASSYQAPGTRLHRKLRKPLHKLGALSLYSSSKQEPESSWMIFLFSICKGSFVPELFHCSISMLYIGCPITLISPQDQLYRVCCSRSWHLKEVYSLRSPDPCKSECCLAKDSAELSDRC